VALLAALWGLGPAAQAQSWTWGHSASWQAEAEHAQPGGGVGPGKAQRSRAAFAAEAARVTERSEWRQSAQLGLRPSGSGQPETVDGLVALTGSCRTPRQSLGGALSWQREEVDGRPDTATQIILGEQASEVGRASMSLGHRLTDRVEVGLVASGARRREARNLGGWQEVDQWSLGTEGSWQAQERSKLWLTLSGSGQRAEGRSLRLGSLRLRAEHAWDERWRLDAALSTQWLRQVQQRTDLVCPLPLVLCQIGIVRPVLVQGQVERDSRPTQYSLSVSGAWSPTLSGSLASSRSINLDAPGASREAAHTLRAHWRLDERRALGLALERSTASVWAVAGEQNARLARLQIEGEHQLNMAWRLRAELEARHTRQGLAEDSGLSRLTRIAITLQYSGPIIRSGL